MRKYKEDEFYMPYIRENAGKIRSFEMADELDITIEKLRALARSEKITLRLAGFNSSDKSVRDKKYFEVKPDPFKKPTKFFIEY